MNSHHIFREIEHHLTRILSSSQTKGIIVSGIVGCGKTTAINTCLQQLSQQGFSIFSFSGDDAVFRAEIAKSTNYLLEQIQARSSQRSILFVDEVQKSEHIFDAVKIAFDHNISFVISGSNPKYLASVARKRLQRRADMIVLLPLSLPEIFLHEDILTDLSNVELFSKHLYELDSPELPATKFTFTNTMQSIIERFFDIGGLPLSFLAESRFESLKQIQMVVERGFEVMTVDTNNVSDLIKVELAKLNSQEFSYQGIFQRTAIRNRDEVNAIIEEMLGHGYLCARKPIFPNDNRRSYLSKYSYIDPGIVTYLSASAPSKDSLGFRVEAMVEARLRKLLENIPLKSQLGYFKPYTVDDINKTRFLKGEIDFVVQFGKRFIPIEVKASQRLNNSEFSIMEKFIADYDSPFGIVLYGGVPQLSANKKMLFWPYWLV